IIGLERLLAIHLNDSVRDLGSRVDRHAHIGLGKIGLTAFAELVNDNRLANLPTILETPKGADDAGRDWDEVNAAALRGLLR
ncbi:MAG: deoxyribonuclease IV, partial [Phycisphaerae bacterium]|nr:deoxyribonuclease IV [Phycisphaerae bacterium]